jgi:hypothetical protein
MAIRVRWAAFHTFLSLAAVAAAVGAALALPLAIDRNHE